MIKKIFGSDGVNIQSMTVEATMSLGKALACKIKTSKDECKIIIGKDTRVPEMFKAAFISGICSIGVDAICLTDQMPSAAIAYLTKNINADAGVMISASYDNSIKIFGKDGFRLSDKEEIELEKYVEHDLVSNNHWKSKMLAGRIYKMDDARGRYIIHLKSSFSKYLDLRGLRIAVDCANGTSHIIAPKVFEELGAKVFPININPDEKNINDSGTISSCQLAVAVRLNKCDIGIALNGNADKLLILNKHGEIVNGDVLLAILMGVRSDKLPVFTTTSNLALIDYAHYDVCGKKPIVIDTDAGGKYIAERMRNGNYSFGGENSGHIVFSKYSTTGDGIIAALKVLEIMKKQDMSVDELQNSVMVPYFQTTIDIKVSSKLSIKDIDGLSEKIRQIEDKIKGSGRVLIRQTKNLMVRVIVESKNNQNNGDCAMEIAEIIRKSEGKE